MSFNPLTSSEAVSADLKFPLNIDEGQSEAVGCFSGETRFSDHLGCKRGRGPIILANHSPFVCTLREGYSMGWVVGQSQNGRKVKIRIPCDTLALDVSHLLKNDQWASNALDQSAILATRPEGIDRSTVTAAV
ncbi:hypothetical protein AVEN_215152-1 [Araneus ventricosus]|uniref:Uncharacterized protein n=1 Tax=Araneus ventricosus TaxID=182803 RepID=A0A4Y2V0K6_ARAVE|nr:hypothetical protein AVEN_215152-1 [Araneus ventricosus]